MSDTPRTDALAALLATGGHHTPDDDAYQALCREFEGALLRLEQAASNMADSYAVHTRPFDGAAHLIENEMIVALRIAREAMEES
jgi:hypothetical protein